MPALAAGTNTTWVSGSKPAPGQLVPPLALLMAERLVGAADFADRPAGENIGPILILS